MLHTYLVAPVTQHERMLADIAHVEQMLATTRASRFYFAGRERTRREWMTWLEYQRNAIN